MFRIALAVALGGLLYAASTALHIISTAYLAGVLSGLLLGMVLWMKVRWRKHRTKESP